MIDLHIHTRFSHDSKEQLENYIERAIELKKTAIGFSDHYDYRCIECNRQIPLPDPERYTETIFALKDKYKDRIKVLCGLEVGYCEEAIDKNRELYEKYPFDYFINSVHMIHGKDCFHNEFSVGLTAKQAYALYFECVLESLNAPYPFEIIGHLCYASRYTHYEDKKIRYEDFKELIDEILKRMIEKRVALEINTSAGGAGSLFLPDTDIVFRYIELGGDMFTFGSDAHTVCRYCDKEPDVVSALRKFGVKYGYYFENRKAVKEPL